MHHRSLWRDSNGSRARVCGRIRLRSCSRLVLDGGLLKDCRQIHRMVSKIVHVWICCGCVPNDSGAYDYNRLVFCFRDHGEEVV
jgi:hypothetical protein